jgi:putative acetyltransferase
MTAPAVIRIRAFESHDVRALIDIFRSAVRLIARRDYTLDQVTAWAPDEMNVSAWEARGARQQTFLAEIDGVPVGFASLEPDGHLDLLFVHAEHQRCGVATALLARVESAARDRGLTRLFTESSITARAFFARRGFQMNGPQQVCVRGQEFINYRMEKLLWVALDASGFPGPRGPGNDRWWRRGDS